MADLHGRCEPYTTTSRWTVANADPLYRYCIGPLSLAGHLTSDGWTYASESTDHPDVRDGSKRLFRRPVG